MTHRGEPWYTTRQITIGITAYAVIGAAVSRDLLSLGILQQTVIGVALVALRDRAVAPRVDGMQWLAFGIAVRGVLALVESVRLHHGGAAGARRFRRPGSTKRSGCSCPSVRRSTPPRNG